MVGLSNQGATCYMNSLIQSLYSTPIFRKIVYEYNYNKGKSQIIPKNLKTLILKIRKGWIRR